MKTECPHCKEVFEISANLLGKGVMCGHCSTKFIAEGQEVVIVEKITPVSSSKRANLGKSPGTEFKKATRTNILEEPSSVNNEQRWSEPAPLQYIFLILGVFIFVGTIVFFIFHVEKPFSLLAEMKEMDRLLLSVFLGLLVLLNFIFAFRRHRWIGFVVGFLGLILTIAVAYWYESEYKIFEQKLRGRVNAHLLMKQEDKMQHERDQEEKDSYDTTKEPSYIEGNIDPLLQVLKNNKSGEVLGLWVNGTNDNIDMQISRWLQRIYRLDSLPPIFKRANKSTLFVVVPAKMGLDVVSHFAEKIGSIGHVNPEKRLLVLDVSTSFFDSIPTGDLNDVNGVDFYTANLNELRSIDTYRVRDAAIRLKNAPPTVLKSDMRDTLSKVFDEGRLHGVYSDLEASTHVAQALCAWANKEDKQCVAMVENLLEELEKVPSSSKPKDLMVFLVAQKSSYGLTLLRKLWESSPMEWQSVYLESPDSMEEEVLSVLKRGKLNLSQRRSMVTILEKWATKKSLPQLDLLVDDSDADVRMRVENTRKRLMEQK